MALGGWAAQAYLTAALRDQDLGRFQDPSHTTLGEYMKQWLQKVAKPRLRERSFRDYQFVKRYISPSLGHVKLLQLRPLAVQNFYLELRGRGLSPASIRKTHTVLSSSLDQSVRWGMLGHNPALSVELPRNANAHQRKELLVLTPEEAGRFLEACKENRWGAAPHRAYPAHHLPHPLRWRVALRRDRDGAEQAGDLLARRPDGRARRASPVPRGGEEALRRRVHRP